MTLSKKLLIALCAALASAQEATVWLDLNGQPVKTDVPWQALVTPAQSVRTVTASIYGTYKVSPTTLLRSTNAPVASTATAAASVSTAVRVATQAPSSAASGSCQGEAHACTGEVTHWDGGLSACGPVVDTNTQMRVSMPHLMMEAIDSTWPSPYCGRSVTVLNPTTGITVQATVMDKCMGCEGSSIDLTAALFNAVAPKCDGRCGGFQWWFN